MTFLDLVGTQDASFQSGLVLALATSTTILAGVFAGSEYETSILALEMAALMIVAVGMPTKTIVAIGCSASFGIAFLLMLRLFKHPHSRAYFTRSMIDYEAAISYGCCAIAGTVAGTFFHNVLSDWSIVALIGLGLGIAVALELFALIGLFFVSVQRWVLKRYDRLDKNDLANDDDDDDAEGQTISPPNRTPLYGQVERKRTVIKTKESNETLVLKNKDEAPTKKSRKGKEKDDDDDDPPPPPKQQGEEEERKQSLLHQDDVRHHHDVDDDDDENQTTSTPLRRKSLIGSSSSSSSSRQEKEESRNEWEIGRIFERTKKNIERVSRIAMKKAHKMRKQEEKGPNTPTQKFTLFEEGDDDDEPSATSTNAQDAFSIELEELPKENAGETFESKRKNPLRDTEKEKQRQENKIAHDDDDDDRYDYEEDQEKINFYQMKKSMGDHVPVDDWDHEGGQKRADGLAQRDQENASNTGLSSLLKNRFLKGVRPLIATLYLFGLSALGLVSMIARIVPDFEIGPCTLLTLIFAIEILLFGLLVLGPLGLIIGQDIKKYFQKIENTHLLNGNRNVPRFTLECDDSSLFSCILSLFCFSVGGVLVPICGMGLSSIGTSSLKKTGIVKDSALATLRYCVTFVTLGSMLQFIAIRVLSWRTGLWFAMAGAIGAIIGSCQLFPFYHHRSCRIMRSILVILFLFAGFVAVWVQWFMKNLALEHLGQSPSFDLFKDGLPFCDSIQQ